MPKLDLSKITDADRQTVRVAMNKSLRDVADRMKISHLHLYELELGNRPWSDTLRARWDRAMQVGK